MTIGEYISNHAFTYEVQEACKKICNAYGVSLSEDTDSYTLICGGYNNGRWLSIKKIIDIILGD